MWVKFTVMMILGIMLMRYLNIKYKQYDKIRGSNKAQKGNHFNMK